MAKILFLVICHTLRHIHARYVEMQGIKPVGVRSWVYLLRDFTSRVQGCIRAMTMIAMTQSEAATKGSAMIAMTQSEAATKGSAMIAMMQSEAAPKGSASFL